MNQSDSSTLLTQVIKINGFDFQKYQVLGENKDANHVYNPSGKYC